MYLNGHYLDHIGQWNKKSGSDVSHSTRSNIIEPYRDIPTIVEHKLTFTVKNPQTAEELEELFANHEFNVVTVTDFYITKYNGIYNLTKGNISLDAGTNWYTGTIWLENHSDVVRTSFLQEVFDNDFENLQPETSTFGSLINGVAEVGTWGTIGSGFGCTVDDTVNIYSIGYEWWNSIDFKATITLVTGMSNEQAGLLINYIDPSNYYMLATEYDNTWTVWKQVSGVWTQLFSHPFTFVQDIPYDARVIYSAGKFDLFVENIHIGTIYDYDILAGQCAVLDIKDSNIFTNVEVTQYIPPTLNIPAGFNNYKHPKLNRNMWTKDGTLQSYINIDEAPINKTYTSRLNIGDVNVWDTIDNDFSQTYVDPQPLKWQRVYNINHTFKGQMYIENGLFGILYTSAGIYHYVYDQPYRKGQTAWIDFKQNPNYEVWNESYEHRKFQSTNQGIGNWDEKGLNFDGIPQDQTVDRISNVNEIPQMADGGIFQSFDMRLDGITRRDNSPRSLANQGDNWYGAGNVLEHADGNDQNIGVFNSQITSETNNVYDFRANEVRTHQPTQLDIPNFIDIINWTYIRQYGRNGIGDEFLVYRDGLLLASRNGEHADSHTYPLTLDGYVNIGQSRDGQAPYWGNIQNAKIRNANCGKVALRQLKTPLVWHSFDEKDWNNSSRVFVDKGSAGVDLSLNAIPLLKKDGRYNQCIYVDDSDNSYVSASLTAELDSLTTFTVEFWMKYVDVFAVGQDIFRIWDSGTGYNLLRIYLTSNQIWVNFQNSVGGNYNIIEASGNFEFDTDQKWHHFAVTYNGSTGILYIDGVVIDTVGAAFTPVTNPTDINIGDGEWDGYVDELIISDYAKQPHEFGVIIPDAYETGQWYNNYEFDQDEHGNYHRNSNPSAIFELAYNNELIDRVTRTAPTSTSGSNAVGVGKCGLSYKAGDRSGTNYIKWSSPKILNKDWTTQFYFQLDESPSTNSSPLRLNRTTGENFYLQLGTDDIFYFTFTNGATEIENNEFALSYNTIYQIALVHDLNNKYISLYIDGSLYLKSQYNGEFYENYVQLQDAGSKHFVSNLTVHQIQIPPSKFGIFADTEPLPRFYAQIRHFVDNVGYQYTSYKLKSISPELVEMIVNSSVMNNVPMWIESGNYFAHIDFTNQSLTDNEDGLYLDFDIGTEENFEPRFALGMGDTNKFFDMSIIRAFTSQPTPTNWDGFHFMFDNPYSNMILAQHTSDNSSAIMAWYTNGGTEHLTYCIFMGKGVHTFGFVFDELLN